MIRRYETAADRKRAFRLRKRANYLNQSWLGRVLIEMYSERGFDVAGSTEKLGWLYVDDIARAGDFTNTKDLIEQLRAMDFVELDLSLKNVPKCRISFAVKSKETEYVAC